MSPTVAPVTLESFMNTLLKEAQEKSNFANSTLALFVRYLALLRSTVPLSCSSAEGAVECAYQALQVLRNACISTHRAREGGSCCPHWFPLLSLPLFLYWNITHTIIWPAIYRGLPGSISGRTRPGIWILRL